MTDHAFNAVLRDGAERIIEQLQGGEMAGAVLELRRLSMARDAQLHAELSVLTQRLRSSLAHVQSNAAESLADGPAVPTEVRAGTVTCHLERAVEMTEGAAHRTIDRLEACVAECRTGLEALAGADQASVRASIERLQASLQEALLEQAYQDLTGQLIRKVVHTLKDTDDALNELLGLAGQVERMTGFEQPTAASAADAPAPEVVRSQDDVDDLLSQLGT